jgi:uncharacterized protein with von Willebrand factor type A (vWA) domain
VRHRYFHLDAEAIQGLLSELDLRRLFNQLLLAAGGDAEEAMEWMRQLQERGYLGDLDLEQFFQRLEDEQVMQRDARGRRRLSSLGERQIRRSAFEEIFTSLSRGTNGYHTVHASGQGTEQLPETRPYEFGDDVHSIDTARSVHNALKRTQGRLDLASEDLEVRETEHQTSSATVVAIDVSYSMVFYGEDRLTPAKKVALALTELISAKYPKDYVGVISFGDQAEELEVGDITYLQAGPDHTNTREALQLGRRMLARQRQVNKQIFLVTDGHPTAVNEQGRIYKNPWTLDLKIVNRTLEEADTCRRQRVVITTFMLATDPQLTDFVEKMTRINRGRAYFASPYNLSEFIFADYIRNRRKHIH